MIVTKKAYNFTATAVTENNEIKEITLSDYLGENGVVLFFYPKDFTFVCPTEIIAFDNKVEEFKARGFNLIGISTDNEYCHFAWKNTEVNKGGIGQVKFPLVADLNKEIARQYDVLLDESVALRGSFLIDKNMIVRHAVINDLPLGRSVDEMIRMVDALNFFNKNGEVCPANWKKGSEGMKADPEGVKQYLSDNAKKL
ncbi:MAG: peroxiredoxin [Mycoplasma sp.]